MTFSLKQQRALERAGTALINKHKYDPKPKPKSTFDGIGRAVGVVTRSAEFERINALPRRTLDLKKTQDVTPLFAKPGSEMQVWPIQSAALIEASIADGLFGLIAVGRGKTMITLMLPDAMDSKCAVLLVPPRLKKKTIREIDQVYGLHFDLPLDRLHIVAYSELSSAKHAEILNEIKPDLIISDEAHMLSRAQSARTKRFLRYMRENPECRFVALSGTMTRKRLTDYAHLIELALGKNSPLPGNYREVKDWGGALDVDPEYEMRSGVLKRFCNKGESIREGFQRRLVETQGVVATSDDELGVGLVIQKLKPAVPAKVERAIAETKKTWSIDEEEFDSALAMARVLKQLACGYYLHWVWPNGEPDYEWLDARAAWHKAVREVLKRSRAGLDSPLLVAQAAASGRVSMPQWHDWASVKDRPVPPTVAVWLDNFIVDAAICWARKQDAPAIIWYEHKALGERIAEQSGFPHFGAGTDADESTAGVIVCSVRSQGTGKNLQHFCRNLMTTLPVSGQTVEQAVGRTHRPGQMADDVTVDWFAHTYELEKAIASVIDDAHYIESTTGTRQKVLLATRI